LNLIVKRACLLFKLSCLAMLLVLAGCATQTPTISTSEPDKKKETSSPIINVEQQLLGYFTDWEGTPYRLGGNSRNGIDCSAFVRNAYHNVFNVKVPRTTLGQATLGYSVEKNELLPGDLVLFKTSRSVRHVGVVVNGNKFMHVSEKRGVIISALDNIYWRKKYWKAVRPDNGITI